MADMTFNITNRDMTADAGVMKLAELGAVHEKIVTVDADLQNITLSNIFAKRFPDRAFDLGIAEQNMVSFAAGLAHEGFMPYTFTMAPFMSMRACEQVRTDCCYGQLPVRFIATGAGYSNGISGATHSALEDVAIFTSMAGMSVIEPADDVQLCKMLEASVLWEGPLYIRLGTRLTESLYEGDYDYKIGKAMIAHPGDDGAFIVSGVVAHYALEAAKRLKADLGANIRVVDMHTLKPLDKEAIVSAAKTGKVIAAQDHNIAGGLGSLAGTAIAEAGIACKYQVLGCPDHFVPLATTPFLYHINHYDADGLYEAMKAML
nr:transketolase C-terminal domain-containing protein [Maliibacterium massiliense]